MISSADLVQARWDLGLSDQWWLKTHKEVLERLPPHIAADFDCPTRGPHEFVEVSATGVTYRFCKHCNRKVVIREWPDTRGLYG